MRATAIVVALRATGTRSLRATALWAFACLDHSTDLRFTCMAALRATDIVTALRATSGPAGRDIFTGCRWPRLKQTHHFQPLAIPSPCPWTWLQFCRYSSSWFSRQHVRAGNRVTPSPHPLSRRVPPSVRQAERERLTGRLQATSTSTGRGFQWPWEAREMWAYPASVPPSGTRIACSSSSLMHSCRLCHPTSQSSSKWTCRPTWSSPR